MDMRKSPMIACFTGWLKRRALEYPSSHSSSTRALSGDYQRGLTTLRQQVVAWLEAFADLSDERQQLQALGKSARDAVKRLRELWPAEVCSVPYYPAFRVI